jgi:RNA polymerase sigma-70 factor (ECF subfamily)
MDPLMTRSSLLSRIRDPSDQGAWHQFECRYGDLVVRYARARGLQLADAEDVRQIVLISLSRSMRGFAYSRARGRFRDYLACVVRRAVGRWSECPNRRALSLDIEGGMPLQPVAEDTTDEVWDREWTDHHLRLAMAEVRQTSDARSMAVFDRVLAGDAVSSIAAAFGLSEDAVYKIKQRVRDRLRAVVARHVSEEDADDRPTQP